MSEYTRIVVDMYVIVFFILLVTIGFCILKEMTDDDLKKWEKYKNNVGRQPDSNTVIKPKNNGIHYFGDDFSYSNKPWWTMD